MARTAAASGLRIEYGLIAAGIAVAIIAAVNGLGSQVKATFGSRIDRHEVRRPLIRSRRA
ncbi:MAG: Flp family type IVb pilin [Pseudolabrys sp.]